MFNRTHCQLTILGKFEIVLDNEVVIYSVKRSHRAKYVRLEIRRKTGLTIFIPRFYKISDLPDLLRKKRLWILKKLSDFKGAGPYVSEREFCNGCSLPYLGKHLKLKRNNPGTVDHISLKGNILTINHYDGEVRLAQIIEWWYRQQAEKVIKKKVGELCHKLGITCNRLTIRKARTRWGSCSQRGNLNFNWKLIMVPEPVIDYVIIHELTHLKEMNHSKKFWNLVAEHCPQWCQRKKWLEDHEAGLNAI